MAQQQTNIGDKSNTPPTHELLLTEFNTLNSTVNNNSTDAETRLTQITNSLSGFDDRTSNIEDNLISSVVSYSLSALPSGETDGTYAFSTDYEIPIYSNSNVWLRMRDDFPVLDMQEVDMFLVMGQSNADGKADINNLDSAYVNLNRDDILMYASSVDPNNNNEFAPGTWGVMDPGNNTAAVTNRYGPELGFADTVNVLVSGGSSQVYTKPLAMMKFAKGATDLAEDWDASFADNFMYDAMIQAFPDSQTKLDISGYVFNIRGLIWYQGESDAGNETFANNYESNLSAFFLDVRQRLNSPNLPIVICKVDYTSGNEPTYLSTVRQAQQNVADNDNYISIIDTDPYSRRDTVHLDASGMYQLGIDIVDLMTDAISGVAYPTPTTTVVPTTITPTLAPTTIAPTTITPTTVVPTTLAPLGTFDFSVKTDNTGTSNSDQFTLPLYPGNNFDFYVNWGDGTSDTVSSDVDFTHTFTSGAGTYNVSISGQIEGVKFNNAGDEEKLLQITNFGPLSYDNDATDAFYGCSNLTITATQGPNTSASTDFLWFYFGCNKLTSVPIMDLSSGNRYFAMFRDCLDIVSLPDFDFSNGNDASKYREMFRSCRDLTTLDNCTFGSSNSNASLIFRDCWSLTSIPSTLDFSSATSLDQTFRRCISLTSFPIIDTANVTNFRFAWYDSGLTSFPALSTHNGTTFEKSWQNCSSLSDFPLLNLSAGNNFTNSWANCALNSTSIDNILQALVANGSSNLSTSLAGGTNLAFSSWSAQASADYNTLISRGWTIATN